MNRAADDFAAIRARMSTLREPDFLCRVCGAQCSIAPDPPARAVCPEHCEDHEFEYDAMISAKCCKHCGEEAPYDWCDP